jgi:hypothetical protein
MLVLVLVIDSWTGGSQLAVMAFVRACSGTATAFHQQRSKLDNEHEHEHDSGERSPAKRSPTWSNASIGMNRPDFPHRARARYRCPDGGSQLAVMLFRRACSGTATAFY